MKGPLLLMMMGAATLLYADEEHAQSKRWFVVSTMASGETPEEQRGHLESYGIRGASADAYVAEVSKGNEAARNLAAKWNASLCARQSYWESVDFETMAQEVERFVRDQETLYAGLIQKVAAALPEEDRLRFEAMLPAHVEQVALLGEDVTMRIRAGKVDVKHYIGKRCQPELWK